LAIVATAGNRYYLQMNPRLLLYVLSLAAANTLFATASAEPKSHGGHYDVNPLMD
jgi:hypothetical protein